MREEVFENTSVTDRASESSCASVDSTGNSTASESPFFEHNKSYEAVVVSTASTVVSEEETKEQGNIEEVNTVLSPGSACDGIKLMGIETIYAASETFV